MTLNQILEQLIDSGVISADLIDSLSYQAIADIMNESVLVDNPVAIAQVPAPISLGGLLQMMLLNEQAMLLRMPTFSEWSASILQNASVDLTIKENLIAELAEIVGNIDVTGTEQFLQIIQKAISLNARSFIAAVVAALEEEEKLSEATAGAMQTVLSATIDDPAYQAQIPVARVISMGAAHKVDADMVSYLLSVRE